jgi:hypothetical protein
MQLRAKIFKTPPLLSFFAPLRITINAEGASASIRVHRIPNTKKAGREAGFRN